MAREIPGYRSCPECGIFVFAPRWDQHVCDSSRVVEFRFGELRPGIARFERDFEAWLRTPAGRFAAHCAARGR